MMTTASVCRVSFNACPWWGAAPGAGGVRWILKYIEPQTIAIERGLPVGAPPWMRAEDYARVMSGGLRVLCRLPGVK